MVVVQPHQTADDMMRGWQINGGRTCSKARAAAGLHAALSVSPVTSSLAAPACPQSAACKLRLRMHHHGCEHHHEDLARLATAVLPDPVPSHDPGRRK